MSLPISVVIPLGPDPHYLDWLDECVESVYENDPQQIILIDDMSSLGLRWINKHSGIEYYRNDWLIGCSDCFNRGVSLSSTDLCFLMGSDDRFMSPYALETCVNAWETNNKMDGFYSVTIQYENGEIQDLPCNAAAVTKGLWRYTGGFGPSAFSAPDGWLLSILLRHDPKRIVQVDKGRPLYFVRQHNYQDTPRMAGFFNEETISIRNKETLRFNPNPEWAKDSY